MMDDLDPYGEEYTGYDPGYTGDSDSGSTDSKNPVEEKINKRPGAAEVYDPRRFFEIDLPEPAQSYLPKSKTQSNPIPITAVFADVRRMSIHPLGIIDKPAGVSERDWTALDGERLLQSMPEINSFAVEGVLKEKSSAVKDEEETTEKPGTEGTGGSGGDSGESGEEEKPDPTEMPFLDHLEESCCGNQ